MAFKLNFIFFKVFIVLVFPQKRKTHIPVTCESDPELGVGEIFGIGAGRCGWCGSATYFLKNWSVRVGADFEAAPTRPGTWCGETRKKTDRESSSDSESSVFLPTEDRPTLQKLLYRRIKGYTTRSLKKVFFFVRRNYKIYP